MPAFTPKQVLINNEAVAIVQNSLKIISGYGETTVRTAVSGKSVTQVLSSNLETAMSKVSFDLITTDAENDTDPRQLIKIWKLAGNSNAITVIPDGDGKNQYFGQMALTNDPEVAESPDGVISLTWMGKANQLT